MKKPAIISLILGIVIGALAVSIYNKVIMEKHYLHISQTDWRKINLVLDCVKNNYVDEVEVQKVTDKAIPAILSSLDPHSVYMPPQELKESDDDLAGNFEGIGIQFNVPNDTAIVIEVIPGGPSEKIGLQAGDRLLKVDDKVIAGVKFPQDSMVRRMKGKAGTKVLVTVEREGETIPFEITRGKIPTYSLAASFMVNDTTAYLRLNKFSRTTYKEVKEASETLLKKGMKHMIIDLKDNSGGYLDQAYAMSNLFLPKDSMVVYMEGAHRRREELRSDGHGFLQNIGLTVLIDDGSASSSEIFAGSIQDNHRGKIVGRRSFGKGLVQEPFNFSDGSGFRMTVARFHTPSGRCIQKPYSDDYVYEVYKRYNSGEMETADSMKVENGGIIPDIFVPVDTTKVSDFYISCNRKAVPMRFASYYFDTHKAELSQIDDYGRLISYLENAGLESSFLSFAKQREGLIPGKDWAKERPYMMTQVKALVGRYSKLNDNAFYHIYLDIDDTYKTAIAAIGR